MATNFNLTPQQWKILWAVIEIKARDAEVGDNDAALVEQKLLTKLPRALELRVIADHVKEQI